MLARLTDAERRIGKLTVFTCGYWQRPRVRRHRTPSGRVWGTVLQAPFLELAWKHFDPFAKES